MFCGVFTAVRHRADHNVRGDRRRPGRGRRSPHSPGYFLLFLPFFLPFFLSFLPATSPPFLVLGIREVDDVLASMGEAPPIPALPPEFAEPEVDIHELHPEAGTGLA